jgi:hypothetical protein
MRPGRAALVAVAAIRGAKAWGHPDHADDIDLHDLADLVDRLVQQWAAMGDAGIVDQAEQRLAA